MINPTTSSQSTEVVQGLNGITMRMDLLDATGFDVDDYTVAKLLPEGEDQPYQLYADFPYLYRKHGYVEDPARLAVMIDLTA